MGKTNSSEISNGLLTKMLNNSLGILVENFIRIASKDFASSKNIMEIALL